MPHSLLASIASGVDTEQYRNLTWEGSFDEYLDIVVNDPRATRNAYQRIYDMIMYFGFERYTNLRQ